MEAGLENLRKRHPAAAGKLDEAAKRLYERSRAEDGQYVGIMCRDALIVFAADVFSPEFVPSGEEPPKGDNVARRLELCLQHFGQLGGSQELRDLTKKVLAYAFRLQHNREASSVEAERALTYTTLALVELADLLRNASRADDIRRRFGVYKCRVCGSTNLTIAFIEGDIDDEGELVSGHEGVFCTNCSLEQAFITHPGGELNKL